MFGRHFEEQDEIVSRLSRESINALKAHFRDQMTRLDWELVIKLKKTFKID
jgi:translation initiation factor 5B